VKHSASRSETPLATPPPTSPGAPAFPPELAGRKESRGAPAALAFLEEDLAHLEARGLLRSRPLRAGSTADGIVLCSNDYLGLADALSPPAPLGAGASRLVSGERSEHDRLEAALATWLGVERTLAFSSGYAANVGTLSALAGPGDLLLSDALNHASLIDGARLSRAEVAVYPHLDVGAVRALLREHPRAKRRRAWVVTESYFSMDADSPDLGELRGVCDEAGAALVVDEAHAIGVLGPEGRGLCAEAGVVPDVLIGTLGKALGASGAFVAGCEELVLWLWNRARSFVFSTGMSPVVAEGARLNLLRALAQPALRERALARAAELRSGLERLGIRPGGHGLIVPWVIGDAREALRVAANLRAEGVFVQAIRPPTVPEGTSRLRLTTTARHTASDIELVLRVIDSTWERRAPSS
jgi:8-amino-7-oxononanoate synthase